MKPDFSNVRLVVFDVDGVLTDGRLFISEHGESFKCFHVRDGVGIKMLQQHGIPVAVISAKQSGSLAKRMSDLSVQFFRPGSHDKMEELNRIVSELNIGLKQVLYVGDDMIDLPVLRQVGLSLAPADAYPMVKAEVDWLTESKGGEGVAREVADLVLADQFELSEIYHLATTKEFERK